MEHFEEIYKIIKDKMNSREFAIDRYIDKVMSIPKANHSNVFTSLCNVYLFRYRGQKILNIL